MACRTFHLFSVKGYRRATITATEHSIFFQRWAIHSHLVPFTFSPTKHAGHSPFLEWILYFWLNTQRFWPTWKLMGSIQFCPGVTKHLKLPLLGTQHFTSFLPTAHLPAPLISDIFFILPLHSTPNQSAFLQEECQHLYHCLQLPLCICMSLSKKMREHCRHCTEMYLFTCSYMYRTTWQ